MLLDRVGDAPVPKGYLVVESEVAFLQQAAGNKSLLVRGIRLCQWAADFWAGRQIPYRELLSPSQSLQQLASLLTDGEAKAIGAALPDELPSRLHTLSLTDLLQALFPNALWQTRPSKSHAADWLVWLYEKANESVFEPLLAEQARQWQREVDDATYRVYGAANGAAALEILDIWLGLTADPLLTELGKFPREIPVAFRKRASRFWKQELISRRGALFDDLQKLPIPRALLYLAAQESVKYWERQPAYLTKAAYDQLAPYLTLDEQQRLLKLMRPPLPAELPMEPAGVLAWFRDQYLPTRQWQAAYGSEEDRANIQAVARHFMLWYLERYPRALVGDALAANLSFERTASIQKQGGNQVTLLIVLDGLHMLDAAQFLGRLQMETERLTVWENGMAFAPLPTVTEFCKPALLAGVAPEVAEQVPTLGIVLSERRSPVESLERALPGELYIWRILEPDTTYHNQKNSETLREVIDGRLFGEARKVAQVVENVPAEIPLRLIVTSDHGRLLAKARRNLNVPSRMQSHGRAAWGVAGRDFDERGFFIEDGVVYLHAGRFGLPVDAAIVLNEDAFRTDDGKGGSEWYPHGGLFPEEVIVPWIELIRDQSLPKLMVRVRGNGKAGLAGEVTLLVRNPEAITVIVADLVLSSGGRQWTQSVNHTVTPFGEFNQSVALANWPTKVEVEQIVAKLTLRLPNQLAFTVPVDDIQLESIEMYQRDDILKDLDL